MEAPRRSVSLAVVPWPPPIARRSSFRYAITVEIEYDPRKNDWNIRERGLSFERVADFDFTTAKIVQDTRKDYGEARFQALGLVSGRVHVVVFTETDSGIRVISFRKANPREVKEYAA